MHVAILLVITDSGFDTRGTVTGVTRVTVAGAAAGRRAAALVPVTGIMIASLR